MIKSSEIEKLVEMLKARGVFLYHSCQYTDFQSYLELGGIPSRKKLTDENKSFTKFETDAEDKKNGVWDKVFFNLQDFGTIFEKGRTGVPTVYGPILFIVRPESLLEANDVAVALRSAGSPSFDRKTEALSSVEDIDRIFLHSANDGTYRRTYIRSTSKIKEEFGKDYVSNPEISLTVSTGLISLAHVEEVKVDPYMLGNKILLSHIAASKREKNYGLTGRSRKYSKKQKAILKDITNILLTCELSLEEFVKHERLHRNNLASKSVISR